MFCKKSTKTQNRPLSYAKVYDVLAVLAVETFKDKFKKVHNTAYPSNKMSKKRPFLFSESCVSYEIQRHDEVYRTCRNTNKTEAKTDYVAETLVELSKLLTNKGATVDILEQDALKTFDKSLHSCYLYTQACMYVC